MDWLTFWAEVIKAIAWPTAALLIMLIFRKPIAELVLLLQRLKYQGIELEFGRQVQQIANEAKRELPAVALLAEEGRRKREHLAQLAPLSPRAVILEAWIDLEEAAREAAKRHELKLSSGESRAPLLLGHALEEAHILNENKLEIFHQLRNLRNAAAHASEFNFEADSAVSYADAALRLAEFLRQA